MMSVGVREMKANLSRYLRLVREQQVDVAVTVRGKTVARLVPVSNAPRCAREALTSLAARGLLELPAVSRRRTAVRPIVPKADGPSLAETIIEDRR